MRDVELPGPAHREAAWDVVRRFLAVTPVVGAPQLGPTVSLKVETVQPTGSFKVRGGLAAVAATLEHDPGRAVVASSAGNHGLGLAYAASKLGATVTVVVPTGASAAKVSALQQFDVRLVLHGEGYREAETHALALAAEEGSRYVSPYNDPDVIAGQATVARELVDQVPNLGTVVVPCGGGGLLAGVTLGFEGTGVRVVGVESEASPSMSTALAVGAIVPIEVEPTVADGLAGNLEPGAVTVGVALAHGVEVLTVSEADIRSAMAFSASKMGLVLEGAGAVGVAALRAGVITPDAGGRETVVLLTGRNVAPKLLSEVLHSYVSANGATLNYEVTGEGEPLLLIAGCGQPAIAWHLGLVPALVAAGYQVVTFDNRGVEPSSSPPAPYSVEGMTADTVALLDHLGWTEPVRIAGHSMGGWIAETLVLDHPDRVRSAALMGSANAPTAWELAITTVERDLARLDYDLPPLFYATETLRYLPIADIQDNEVVSTWLSMMGDLPVWPNPGRLGQYEAALAWSTDPARTTRWPEVRVPCLVLAFEHDVDSPPRYARQAAESIPGCTYREVAGSGHIGILTHAEQVAAYLTEFFAQH